MVEKHVETPEELEQRQIRTAKHAAWLKKEQAKDLHDSRVELVRRYLANPSPWPDGLDWPNWKEPHELWYTGKEDYWHPLAQALQARLDRAKSVLRQAEKDAGLTGPVNTPVNSPVNTTAPVNNPVNNPEPVNSPVNTPVNSAVNTPADRKAYMREYMRQRRAKATQAST